jgi:hypothetical protein
MSQIIMDHGGSGYFGTKWAPIVLTRSLRNSDDPTSDNLTPQQTTNRGTAQVGTDGDGLSCPGSSVVAEERIDGC